MILPGRRRYRNSPPLTCTVCPVTWADSPESRKTARAATRVGQEMGHTESRSVPCRLGGNGGRITSIRRGAEVCSARRRQAPGAHAAESIAICRPRQPPGRFPGNSRQRQDTVPSGRDSRPRPIEHPIPAIRGTLSDPAGIAGGFRRLTSPKGITESVPRIAVCGWRRMPIPALPNLRTGKRSKNARAWRAAPNAGTRDDSDDARDVGRL